MQARYYDPVIGRFYSNDPVNVMGHITRGNPIHGFNRFTYANNNPYKYTDPDGEFAWLAVPILIGAIVGGLETAVFDAAAGKDFSITSVMKGAAMGAIAGAAGGIGKAIDSIRKVKGAAKTMAELNKNAIKKEALVDTVKNATIGVTVKVTQGAAEGVVNNKKQDDSKKEQEQEQEQEQ